MKDCGAVCFQPMDEIPDITVAGSPIMLTSYSQQAFGQYVVISVTAEVPDSGLVYVTVHLEYGLKHTSGYSRVTLPGETSANPAAALPGADGVLGTADDFVIRNLQPYSFSYRNKVGSGDWSDWHEPTIQSVNDFKKITGIGGMVLSSDGTAVASVLVVLYGPNGNHIGLMLTDEDGWYFFAYKHTGKTDTFAVKLPTKGQIQKLLLKANSFAVCNDFVMDPRYY